MSPADHSQGELPFAAAPSGAGTPGARHARTQLERTTNVVALTSVPAALRREWRDWRNWREWELDALRLVRRFDGRYKLNHFEYRQPVELQPEVPPRLRRAYGTPVAYTEWGPRDAPLLICCGGVANTAMRFSFLAAELAHTHRVVCVDWVGRGLSGWLADGSEYTRDTHVEQLCQLMDHLGGEPAALLGSSMGGSVAIELAARQPQRVRRLILNDVGPYIPMERRLRRAETLARFYVFRSPQEAMRRIGAAQKNDGPMGDDIRLFLTYHQTRWSPENGGRIYRLDQRALLAYREQAHASVDQWAAWEELRCPVMLLHGMESDALSAETIQRMRSVHPLTVAHIPDTGHTPVLSDRHQTHAIAGWLAEQDPPACEFSIPHAQPRVDWHRSAPVQAGPRLAGALPAWLDPNACLAQWECAQG